MTRFSIDNLKRDLEEILREALLNKKKSSVSPEYLLGMELMSEAGTFSEFAKNNLSKVMSQYEGKTNISNNEYFELIDHVVTKVLNEFVEFPSQPADEEPWDY
jgi:hypothetical protein